MILVFNKSIDDASYSHADMTSKKVGPVGGSERDI